MKAYLLERPGAPENLRLADVTVPEPAAGQVRVRVEAVGLNPADYKIAANGRPGLVYPFILGLDVAGIIDRCGDAVTGWKPGDRVYYHGDLRKNGGYAEYALAESAALAPIAGAVTAAQAAALPTAGFTAWQALHEKPHIEKGQVILVHGGSGGVGGFAVQLARRAGLQVLSTASPKNADRVRALGAAHVIDYNGDVAAEVRRLTEGRGVDHAIDTVGPESATKTFGLLAFGGQLVCVAGLPDFTAWKRFEKAPSVHEVALGAAYAADAGAVRRLGRTAERFMALVAAGEIDPLVGETADFGALPQALGRLQRREIPSGKIVVHVSG